MRKVIVLLVILLGIIFIVIRSTELEEIYRTVQQGEWQFILLALIVEIIWLLTVGASYKLIYRSLGMRDKYGHLTLLAAASNFINVVAPSAGIGGVTVFVSEAKRKNLSTGKATAAGAVYVLLDYIGFLSILALGLIVLFRRNNLTAKELIPAGIVMIIAMVFMIVLYLGTRSGERLSGFLTRIVRGINRLVNPIIRRPYLLEENATRYAHELSNGLNELKGNPRWLFLPLALTVTSKILLILILACVFLAFNTPLSIGTLIASFSIAYMFLIVSPTPSGVGFVEGMLTLALTSMYVPLNTAVVIALVYRGITFWVPLLFGLLAFQRLGGTQSLEGR